MSSRPIENVLGNSGPDPRSVVILLDYAAEFEDAQGQLAELVARGPEECRASSWSLLPEHDPQSPL